MPNVSPSEGMGLVPRPWMRRADRRTALPEFLSQVADGLILSAASGDLRERFERALRALLKTERVWLRDEGAGPAAEGGEGLTIEVPGVRSGRAYIEVGLGSRAVYDDWDRQILHAAACAAALVLAADRADRRRRAGPLVRAPAGRRDEAHRVERGHRRHPRSGPARRADRFHGPHRG